MMAFAAPFVMVPWYQGALTKLQGKPNDNSVNDDDKDIDNDDDVKSQKLVSKQLNGY